MGQFVFKIVNQSRTDITYVGVHGIDPSEWDPNMRPDIVFQGAYIPSGHSSEQNLKIVKTKGYVYFDFEFQFANGTISSCRFDQKCENPFTTTLQNQVGDIRISRKDKVITLLVLDNNFTPPAPKPIAPAPVPIPPTPIPAPVPILPVPIPAPVPITPIPVPTPPTPIPAPVPTPPTPIPAPVPITPTPQSSTTEKLTQEAKDAYINEEYEDTLELIKQALVTTRDPKIRTDLKELKFKALVKLVHKNITDGWNYDCDSANVDTAFKTAKDIAREALAIKKDTVIDKIVTCIDIMLEANASLKAGKQLENDGHIMLAIDTQAAKKKFSEAKNEYLLAEYKFGGGIPCDNRFNKYVDEAVKLRDNVSHQINQIP